MCTKSIFPIEYIKIKKIKHLFGLTQYSVCNYLYLHYHISNSNTENMYMYMYINNAHLVVN